jgi:hypothetical protein
LVALSLQLFDDARPHLTSKNWSREGFSTRLSPLRQRYQQSPGPAIIRHLYVTKFINKQFKKRKKLTTQAEHTIAVAI